MSRGEASRPPLSRVGWLFSKDGELSLSDVVSTASCCIMTFRLDVLSTLGTDLDRNLGIGREEAAGDAWNVGPAYAFTGVTFGRFGVREG